MTLRAPPYAHDDRVVTRRYRRFVYAATWLEYKARNVKCGLHSNIPPCCVAWHTLVFYDKAMGFFGQFYRGLVAAQHGYIPCPVCLVTGRRNIVLRCGCYRRHWKTAAVYIKQYGGLNE